MASGSPLPERIPVRDGETGQVLGWCLGPVFDHAGRPLPEISAQRAAEHGPGAAVLGAMAHTGRGRELGQVVDAIVSPDTGQVLALVVAPRHGPPVTLRLPRPPRWLGGSWCLEDLTAPAEHPGRPPVGTPVDWMLGLRAAQALAGPAGATIVARGEPITEAILTAAARAGVLHLLAAAPAPRT